MGIGLLLISLGYGYSIVVQATRRERGRLRKMGQWIGTAMIVASLLAATTKIMYFCKAYCPVGAKGGFICPITGKQLPPDAAQP